MKILPTRSARRTRAGFSLAELMVVIVILGLIATIVVPNLLGRFVQAQKEKAKVDITQIEAAISTFTVQNNGREPDTLEVLVTPDENNRTILQGYTSVPLDPWGHPYQYDPPSAGRPFRIYSFGKDGLPGGDGDDADIDNVTIKNQERR
jgi:general secretion pathway protein G